MSLGTLHGPDEVALELELPVLLEPEVDRGVDIAQGEPSYPHSPLKS